MWRRRVNELSLSSELGPLINRRVLVSPNLPLEYHLYFHFIHLFLYFILEPSSCGLPAVASCLSALHHDASGTPLLRLIANWEVPLAAHYCSHLTPAQDAAAE